MILLNLLNQIFLIMKSKKTLQIILTIAKYAITLLLGYLGGEHDIVSALI